MAMINKIKLLFVTDDIRLPTGVGGQARKLLQGLQATGNYEISQIGGSKLNQPPNVVDVNGIKIFPVSNGYGNVGQFREVMAVTRPDIVIAFSDPRFFTYLFTIDNEIRTHAKFLFYHTWDNDPFPKFNVPWYTACDEILTLSKFSSDLLKSGGINNTCIQHGFDPQEFYKLKPDRIYSVRKDLAKAINREDLGFLIFWNNRNLHRKRMNDVIVCFEKFYKEHPDSALLMNTNAIDEEGNDLIHLLRDLENPYLPVILNLNRVNSERLNEFYNVADVTVNIAFHEGFGLCVGESLLAETPVIATKTGGMTEQMKSATDTFGLLLPPVARELFGIPGAPYIYKDYVNYDQVITALNTVYHSRGYFEAKGKKGREFIIDNFSIASTVDKWNNFLISVKNSASKYKRYDIVPILPAV
jgi:glycosyltransferase involved in cell wall biosynthesis